MLRQMTMRFSQPLAYERSPQGAAEGKHHSPLPSPASPWVGPRVLGGSRGQGREPSIRALGWSGSQHSHMLSLQAATETAPLHALWSQASQLLPQSPTRATFAIHPDLTLFERCM